MMRDSAKEADECTSSQEHLTARGSAGSGSRERAEYTDNGPYLYGS